MRGISADAPSVARRLAQGDHMAMDQRTSPFIALVNKRPALFIMFAFLLFTAGVYRHWSIQRFLSTAIHTQGQVISRDNGVFSQNRVDIQYVVNGHEYVTWAIDPKRSHQELQAGATVEVLYDPSHPSYGVWPGSLWRMRVFPVFAMSFPFLMMFSFLQHRTRNS